MNTTWRVTKVTETEGSRIAELARVEWFKPNPAYTAAMERFSEIEDRDGSEAADADWASQYGDDEPSEFVEDVDPGEEGADFIDAGNTMTLDITDGLDLHAGDNVRVNIDALDRVSS